MAKEDHNELVEVGRTDVALDVLAKRGDWERLWEVAAKERTSPAEVGRYALMRAEELSSGNGSQIDEAVKLLQKRPGPAADSALPTYRRLVQAVLGRSSDSEKAAGADQAGTISGLREVCLIYDIPIYHVHSLMRSHTRSVP